MNSDLRRLATLLAVSVGLLAVTLQAAEYELNFDEFDDGVLAAPFVGNGTVRFDGPAPGDGEIPFNSLTNLDLNISFGPDSFTNAEIVTPLEEILLVFSNGGQSLNFSNTMPGGTGPFGGAVDFINADSGIAFGLSTEPPGTGGNLDRYFLADAAGSLIYFGNYGGELVPEPATGLIGLIGLALACGAFRRR